MFPETPNNYFKHGLYWQTRRHIDIRSHTPRLASGGRISLRMGNIWHESEHKYVTLDQSIDWQWRPGFWTLNVAWSCRVLCFHTELIILCRNFIEAFPPNLIISQITIIFLFTIYSLFAKSFRNHYHCRGRCQFAIRLSAEIDVMDERALARF